MREGRKARLSKDRRLWQTRKEKHVLGDLEECQAAAVFRTKDHRKPMLRANSQQRLMGDSLVLDHRTVMVVTAELMLHHPKAIYNTNGSCLLLLTAV